MRLLLLLALLACSASAQGPLPIDRSRPRPLASWKKQIATYSARHYGEKTWELEPKCIVLHYTAGASFPWNLVNTPDFAGETPGLASHYVVDGGKVWELLPPNVRSRGAYGINHRALNIEMVGKDATDMAARTQTLDTSARLVAQLMKQFNIPLSEIYSHEQVATMNPKVCRWVKDLVRPEPYDKVDPGQAAMDYILQRLQAR